MGVGTVRVHFNLTVGICASRFGNPVLRGHCFTSPVALIWGIAPVRQLSSPFCRQTGENVTPFFPSTQINIKHSQTPSTCTWLQQCEIVAMSVKMEVGCDCVCSDIFKPFDFFFPAERLWWDESFELCCVRVWLVSVFAADETSILMWLDRQTSCSSPFSS